MVSARRRVRAIAAHIGNTNFSSVPVPPPARANTSNQPEAADVDFAEDVDDSLYEDQVAMLAMYDEMPVIVLESILPRQHVKILIQQESHKIMVAKCLKSDTKRFGIVGMDPMSKRALSVGVEVEIIATMIDDTTGSMTILVVGRRRLTLEGTAWCQDGYSMAKVELELQDDEVFDEETPERSSAELLMTMVGKWIELARPGALTIGNKEIEHALGPMPPPAQAGSLALWVAALINPPANAEHVGVSIRPAVLAARTTHELLSIVTEGLQTSTQYFESKMSAL